MLTVLLTEFFTVMLGAALVNNLVLIQFLGVSSFFNSSRQFNTAVLLAFFSAPVLIGTMLLHFLLNRFVLQTIGLQFLQLVSLVVIAGLLTGALLQLVRYLFPQSTRQQFTMLFMVGANSAVLGAALQTAQKNIEFIELIALSFGSALGFSLILLAFAALNERLAQLEVPLPFKGLAIQLLSAGLAALALLGFAGVV